MPLLTWPSKSDPLLQPCTLRRDSLVFPRGIGYPQDKPASSLILGENLAVISSLLAEYEGRLDLIYADPPFFTNKHFPARIGRGEDSRRPAEWQLAEGYTDQWNDLDSYLDFLYPRLALMKRLLSPRGSLYLHLDWHASAYARLLLDELFGREHLINEIIWTYHGPSPIRRAFNRKHDTILAYAMSADYIFNADAVRAPYNPSTVKTFASSRKAGFGKIPDLLRGKVPEDWWYFPVVARLHNERTGYPTQKPEALLERILLAGSDPGSLVADFFCGSGGFPHVAARHGRHFIACDATWRAVHTTRLRLLEDSEPFTLWRAVNSEIPVSEDLLSFSRSGNSIKLETKASLDYWEVDPTWNGLLFHSVAQVRRPNRADTIEREIKLPKAGTKVRIRAVTVDGKQLESV
jgi:site-specific DNA-methyltransferase (adenine-specific)